MRLLVGLSQPFGGDVGVELGGGQRRVTEHLLHRAQIGASLEQMGGHRVPQTVRAEIGGVRRQWVAMILEQIPDQKVSWAAMEGATNAGTVTFAENGVGQTRVTLSLEYEPEGFLETLGDKLGLVERQVQEDLDRFRDYIESQGQASGGWRGAAGLTLLWPCYGP